MINSLRTLDSTTPWISRVRDLVDQGDVPRNGKKVWYEMLAKIERGEQTLHSGNNRGVSLLTEFLIPEMSGTSRKERALVMGLSYAAELDVTPWEALLSQVRLLAGQVEYLRMKVSDAERKEGDKALLPGGEGWHWVVLLEGRGDRLARVAKMAIDAGVAEYLVRRVQLEGESMYRIAVLALEHAGIGERDRERILGQMASELLALEEDHNARRAL